jgi:hypothetical protein
VTARPRPAVAGADGLDARRPVLLLVAVGLAARRPLYSLLPGVAGGPAAVGHVDRKLDAAARESDTTDLAAQMMADLELRGLRALPGSRRPT